MFGVYVAEANPDNPLAALELGDRHEPEAPQGWATVRVRAASLNHHDVFSLQGVGLPANRMPMTLGTDAAGSASQASSAGANAARQPSGNAATPQPRLLSPTSNAVRGAGDKTIDVSGSGAANGNTNANAGSTSGASGSTNASGRAGGQASAHGSTRDGISTSAQADGDAGASANAQQH